jgi:Glycosyl transferase family 2
MSAHLTACLIVQNEQDHLTEALSSVCFCDEIVVVDGGSTDRTADIARAAGAKVIENPWPGFAAQRNIALDNAVGDWVLEIDADERVSPQLRASIERLIEMPGPEAKIAVCALRNRFLGGLLGPSAKYPAYRSRLFRRGAYRHDESRQVHEGIEPRERPVVLDGDLEHELASTLREALGDAWRYARLESEHLTRPPRARTYVVGIVLRPTAKIAYRTIVDGGWRDGWRGLLKIVLDAASDALVWTLVLVRGKGALMDGARVAPTAPRGHFGRRPAGAPKVVAIAGRGRPAQVAGTWLARLAAAGVDATLVSDEANLDAAVPTRIVSRLGPLTTMRALDQEMELRTIQLVVPFGHRAKLVHRILPRTLRPSIEGLDAELDANAALRAIGTEPASAAGPSTTRGPGLK